MGKHDGKNIHPTPAPKPEPQDAVIRPQAGTEPAPAASPDGEKPKKKKKGHAVTNVIIVILLIVIGVSGYQVAKIWLRYHKGTEAYKDIAKTAGMLDVNDKVDWDTMIAKYPDLKAWISQKDTVINYPIAQAENNSKYLHHLLSGEYQTKGTLFIDYRNAIPFSGDFVTIIYGHRMKDGSMFWTVGDYRKQEYYDEHPTFFLQTPEKDYTMQVFAYVPIPADSSLYNPYVSTDEDKAKYLSLIESKNVLSTDVTVTPQDHIVMLSTCTYEYDNARAVVYCKLVEKSESNGKKMTPNG